MIELGQEVQDVISGFKGIVTGRVDYITGCSQLLVAPKASADGTLQDSKWFDEQRVEVVADGRRVTLNNSKTPGFDAPAPIR